MLLLLQICVVRENELDRINKIYRIGKILKIVGVKMISECSHGDKSPRYCTAPDESGLKLTFSPIHRALFDSPAIYRGASVHMILISF